MEYMLLRDGSVKTFTCLPEHSDVMDALGDYDGVAYYWYTLAFGWSKLDGESPYLLDPVVSADVVPDVIKLAAMLE